MPQAPALDHRTGIGDTRVGRADLEPMAERVIVDRTTSARPLTDAFRAHAPLAAPGGSPNTAFGVPVWNILLHSEFEDTAPGALSSRRLPVRPEATAGQPRAGACARRSSDHGRRTDSDLLEETWGDAQGLVRTNGS
ncbi:hypothetical protein [Nocardia callitridis]|uniref:Uncharacterized protein n=1 Tax=Nocardia callitridis TaxID=648753 RepID=A0ABP9JYJ8_9NOCA